MKEMTRIITVAREYGSGGAEVGRRVAEALGWEFIDRSLIQKIAELARVPASVASGFDERAQSWMERLLSGFRVAAPEAYAGPDPSVIDANTMRRLTEHVIRAAAGVGNCVIVGRGSQCVLANREDALHVFVYAPIEARLKRLRKRLPEEKNLRTVMADVDRERALYVRQHYHCAWDDRLLYGVCVNSALGINASVAVIEQAANLAVTTR